MKILVVTNMYPGTNNNNLTQGIFVEEQVKAMQQLDRGRVDVCVVDGFRSKIAYVSSILRVLIAIRKYKHDVVHFHFGLSAISAPFVRLLTRSKVVVTFHGSDVMGGSFSRIISLLAARSSNASIAVSEPIARRLNGTSKKCWVIPCAVNEQHFRESLKEKTPRLDSKLVVFASSPARREKDYPLFARVIEILQRSSGFRIVEKHIDGLDRDAVRTLLGIADCLLLTSQREGSPQSVKEAMAMNLPVVSVDVGDVRHLFGESDAGVVIEDRNEENLAREVETVLKKGTRTHGRKRLEEMGCFSSNVAERVWSIYELVTSKEKRALSNLLKGGA